MNLIVKTHKKDEVLDITDEIEKVLEISEKSTGLCHIFVQHTTCCITTADLDPGTDLDLLDALRSVLPQLDYRHPHDPSHAPDHMLSSMIGPSVTVPFSHGQLELGVWQRVILIEFDGPRERHIKISLV